MTTKTILKDLMNLNGFEQIETSEGMKKDFQLLGIPIYNNGYKKQINSNIIYVYEYNSNIEITVNNYDQGFMNVPKIEYKRTISTNEDIQYYLEYALSFIV